MTRPFPYVLIRCAALPCSTFLPFQLHGRERHIKIQQHITNKLAAAREELCNAIYNLIPQQSTDERRNQLITIKRAIYNNRSIAGRAAAMDSRLPPAIISQLQQYDAWQQKLTALSKNWEQYYVSRLHHHRSYLQQLSVNEQLQQGLVLSSGPLYEQLPHFIKKDPAGFRHKELKNEYSLLRYLTRMTFKTSPFSTFTSTGVTQLSEQQYCKGPSETLQTASNTRCNNALFTYIQDLLLQHPSLNELLQIKLNNTAVVQNNTVRFLVIYYNIESFQQMPATGLVQWIIQYSRSEQAITLAGLTNEIVSLVPDCDRQQAKAFLMQLITAGLLEAGTLVSGIHPDWDIELRNFLFPHSTQYPALQPLCTLLQYLTDTRRHYNTAAAAERHQLLIQSADMLNNTLSLLQTETGITPGADRIEADNREAIIQQWKKGRFRKLPFMPRTFLPAQIFYEDSYVIETSELALQPVQQFISKAQAFCNLLSSFDPMQHERRHMQGYFIKKYSPEASIPVVDFYHTYYLEEKKQRLHQAADRSAAAGDSTDAGEQLLRQLNLAISTADVFSVSIKAIDDPSFSADPRRGSAAMFVQFISDGNTYKGIINHFLPGMGKVAGRFLDLFEEPVTNTFNTWNAALYPDHLLMELSDGSGFNANIHPPLLPYELHFPGGQNNFPESRQLHLKDLHVQFDDTNRELYLWHTGLQQKVFAYDLSLESFNRRSHFYQLLAHFNREHRLLLRQFNKLIDQWTSSQKAPANKGVIPKPRIVYDEQVILRRAGWVIETPAIPALAGGESEPDWFLRLNNWRQQQEIPEQVFVYLKSSYLPAENKNQARDDHKPQYIHFGSPLLAGVFKKMISRCERIYIEEMLPAVPQETNSRYRVTEHLIHWYNFN